MEEFDLRGLRCPLPALMARKRLASLPHGATIWVLATDPLAVVDERLRVRGFERLRVIDASVMPTITSGNTNTPTIMIADKAARMVIEDAMA